MSGQCCLNFISNFTFSGNHKLNLTISLNLNLQSGNKPKQARNGSIMVGLIYKDELLCHEYDQGHFPLYDHGLGNHYDIGFDLGHLQDIDTSKGFDRDDGYDDDENYDDNHDGHIALEGPL